MIKNMRNKEIQVYLTDMKTTNAFSAEVIAPICIVLFKESTFEYYFATKNLFPIKIAILPDLFVAILPEVTKIDVKFEHQ